MGRLDETVADALRTAYPDTRFRLPTCAFCCGMCSRICPGNARRCADLFDCPVGVEGHYPTAGDTWLLASWDEYRTLFDSGVPYALDLSHLHIVANHSGRREDTLVAEMLASDRCLEIHVSDNDGRADRHAVCVEPPWWFALLRHAHGEAVIFSEGNHRRMGGLA